MTSVSARAEDGRQQSLASLKHVYKVWLGLIFVIGLGYIVLVPTFQAIDEVAHWDRMWTVARGQYNCKTLPWTAAQFVDFGFQNSQKRPIPWSFLRDGYEHVGGAGEFMIATNGCHYPPIGYLPAALGARLAAGDPTIPAPHKMFRGFYAARLTNWLLFFGCLVAALRISLFPMPTLLFASIPMVLLEVMSLNNDSVVLGCGLLLAALLTRQATRARAWSVVLLITIVSAIKPIHLIASTLLWINLWATDASQRMRRGELVALVVASLALPIAMWQLWNLTMHVPILGLTTGMPVHNTDEAVQLQIMREQPTRFFSMLRWQLEQFFTGTPINGGWRGFLLTLGWYLYEAPSYVYNTVLAALCLGLPLIRVDARGEFGERRVPALLKLITAGAMFAYFVAVTLILYLTFTPIGAEVVFGVQGRYFFYPLILLLFLFPMLAKPRSWLQGRGARIAALAFMALSVAGHLAALLAIREFFWQA